MDKAHLDMTKEHQEDFPALRSALPTAGSGSVMLMMFETVPVLWKKDRFLYSIFRALGKVPF